MGHPRPRPTSTTASRRSRSRRRRCRDRARAPAPDRHAGARRRAANRGRLRRCARLATHAGGAGPSLRSAGATDDRRRRPPPPHRARSRRPHSGGERGVDHGGDHRGPVRARRAALRTSNDRIAGERTTSPCDRDRAHTVRRPRRHPLAVGVSPASRARSTSIRGTARRSTDSKGSRTSGCSRGSVRSTSRPPIPSCARCHCSSASSRRPFGIFAYAWTTPPEPDRFEPRPARRHRGSTYCASPGWTWSTAPRSST